MSQSHRELHPDSEADRILLENVRPADWENPVPDGRYNLVVLGAGAGGLVTAAGAAGVGAKVALIEENLMGGDCLNVGCVPSKGILRSAHAAHDVRSAGQFGIGADPAAPVDFAAVMERMRAARARISPIDSPSRFRDELGVDVYLGRGRFTSPDTVQVGDAELRFRKAVIATGGRPVVPPIPGLQEAGYYTNETLFAIDRQPKRLLVIGGGPIGCELAQAFARLGSHVSIVETNDQFLAREDRDAAALLESAFERDGIDVHLATSIDSIDSSGESTAAILLRDGVKSQIEADAILVGAGRAPNVDELGLEAANVGFDRATGVTVDDHLRTSNPRIYAVGDVCMKHKFTHAADFAARMVVRNALFFGGAKLSELRIPWCTYTDPEIAHVGLYAHEAAARGIEIDTFEREFADVDRTILDATDEGFVKVHVERGKDRILGATIAGRHAGDLISEISVAMAGGLGLSKLANVIHPYPTQAEAIRQCGDQFNRTRLTPRVKRLFERYLAFVR